MILIIMAATSRRKVEVGVMADGCWCVVRHATLFLCDVWGVRVRGALAETPAGLEKRSFFSFAASSVKYVEEERLHWRP